MYIIIGKKMIFQEKQIYYIRMLRIHKISGLMKRICNESMIIVYHEKKLLLWKYARELRFNQCYIRKNFKNIWKFTTLKSHKGLFRTI